MYHYWLGLILWVWLVTHSVWAHNLPQFTQLVKRASPAVVNITTRSQLALDQTEPDTSDQLFDELYRRFFDERGQSLPFDTNPRGSGFILSSDGYIVTNHHVVAKASEIVVRLSDRREFKAQLIGSDLRTDVALLKVSAKNLPTVKMGNSDRLEVGEWVLAIGSPFGFDHSATSGIVSALGRSLPSDNYVPFIQTDVAINPGNSGGPLFNLAGQVIGINSQIYSRSGGFMGVSFAIPIKVALGVIEQLKTKGYVSRGWLGVYIQEVDQELAESFNLLKPTGALVAQVTAGGPAEGVLQIGDVILEFNGRAVPNATVLPSMVGMTAAGTPVHLTIMREGQRQMITLTLSELPAPELPVEDLMSPTQPDASSNASLLGMELSELDEQIKQTLKITEGVLVDRVLSEPARSAKVEEGDVITLMDGKQIRSRAELRGLIQALKPPRMVPLLVNRQGVSRFIALKVN
ncbi:DegQ family serine endoprotease [Thiofilum flexile]|uniref:DegQ family serine endoprotease n=1 Tax=Thiofilum flexile TaxID=125627 RepID=UPI000374F908|nr:DegQ family serine endoprotease [Thiofilum flexile]